MNLPNKLTMMRVIMVPFFMVFAAMSHMGTLRFNATYALIAGILFAVASFTDFLDGYLARKNHLVTDFGKFMDPLADKMPTTAAIIYMVVDGVCSPVVLAIIMFRLWRDGTHFQFKADTVVAHREMMQAARA